MPFIYKPFASRPKNAPFPPSSVSKLENGARWHARRFLRHFLATSLMAKHDSAELCQVRELVIPACAETSQCCCDSRANECRSRGKRQWPTGFNCRRNDGVRGRVPAGARGRSRKTVFGAEGRDCLSSSNPGWCTETNCSIRMSGQEGRREEREEARTRGIVASEERSHSSQKWVEKLGDVWGNYRILENRKILGFWIVKPFFCSEFCN